MSFLSDNFSDDMRTLSIERKSRAKNNIGEMVQSVMETESFRGVILTDRYGSDRNIGNDVGVHTSSYILYTDLGISINRDDIIMDGIKKYIVKDDGLQEDFGGNNDCQRILLERYV